MSMTINEIRGNVSEFYEECHTKHYEMTKVEKTITCLLLVSLSSENNHRSNAFINLVYL